MIRHAVESDRSAMLRMGRDFLRAAALPIGFNAAWADQSLAGHLEDPARLSLVLDLNGGLRGMLCAGWTMSPLAPVRVATELVFWIDPDARGRWARRFIAEYEKWANAQGCAVASLASVGSVGADSLYQRCGFVPAERHFMKVF